MRKKYFNILFLAFSFQTSGQSPETLMIRDYRYKNEHAIINEFVSFLAIPNLATDTLNIQKNAAFIMEMMHKRGIGKVQLLSPSTPERHLQYMEK